MKKKNKLRLFCGLGLIFAFILWTVLVCIVDVRISEPEDSMVGFATINIYFHELFGVNMLFYTVTDWLGLVPIGAALGFALLGLIQWIGRKSLFKVDLSLFILGAFYLIVMGVYIFFEFVIINYRPVLIDGYLEASYPSSTAMLTTTVMPTSIIQLNSRIKRESLKKCISAIISLFTVLMVAFRLVSGVHWVSDIIGGLLFSIGIVEVYHSVFNSLTEKLL